MKSIEILGEIFEYEVLEVGVDFIRIDDVTYSGISEKVWTSIKCAGIDILAKRNKAIAEVEKSKNIPDKVMALQEENLDIIQVATALFEENLSLKEENEGLKSKDVEIESQLLDLMEVVTNMYEVTLG